MVIKSKSFSNGEIPRECLHMKKLVNGSWMVRGCFEDNETATKQPRNNNFFQREKKKENLIKSLLGESRTRHENVSFRGSFVKKGEILL